MKIAIVHEWLATFAGSERVVAEMLKCFPHADLYALVDFLPDSERSFLGGRTVRTSFLQKMPWAKTKFRHYLPLMPLAIEQFDLSSYDVVISSSHAVAKGVITGPDQLHLCMCYSPIRYAWDLQHQYLAEANFRNGLSKSLARLILHYMRLWDVRTANGVDGFIAISEYIGRRIRKIYRRESTVVYPPVDIQRFDLREDKDDFYLTASRFVPYKRIPLIVDAFRQLPDKRLVVIGDGPEFAACKATAPANVTMMGWQSTEVLVDHMQRARAFLFAAEEDFGITPLEAQACGTPVIAFGKGGSLETIRGLASEEPTGVFFETQEVPCLLGALEQFESNYGRFSAQACRRNAARFGQDIFRERFMAYFNEAWAAHRSVASQPSFATVD